MDANATVTSCCNTAIVVDFRNSQNVHYKIPSFTYMFLTMVSACLRESDGVIAAAFIDLVVIQLEGYSLVHSGQQHVRRLIQQRPPFNIWI